MTSSQNPPTAQKTDSGAMMALVFLARSGFADGDRLQSTFRAAFPEAAGDINRGTDKDPLFFFFYEGVLCNVMCIDAQAPLAATDPEFRNAAWLWPKAWDELRVHRAHMIVSVAGGQSGKHRGLILQRLLRAIFTVSLSALGIHYTSGTLLPKKMVVPLLQQGGELALMLFVSCYFARETAERFPRPGILASTKGLQDFGSMEIEARGFTGSVQDLYAWLLSFASGLLYQQFHIKDGDTVSVGEGEPVKVKIEKSMFYDANVYCLHFQ